ncbi:MAG: 50S ribosomal protein L29 [Lachnospiraceae bacterium]|nr:50S ribosomal protein L29 [Lachnospiraceae bacterium]
MQLTSSPANAKLFQKQIWKAVYQMKTNKYVEDLQAKSVTELADELTAAKKELFNLRFQNATNQLDNTSRIKEVRKNIARIQTVITQKNSVAE